MSISSMIAPYLPYLRRYARAVTGRQESGDAYVVATLEALVADPTALRTDVNPRVALYALFTALWSSVRINTISSPPMEGSQAAAEARLADLTPQARQAFLLVTVEQFPLADAAAILDVEDEAISALIEAAGREIAEQVATDVLIIEDEPIIAMDLEQLVTSMGHRVMGIARTRKQAVDAINSGYPGIVLADIQLADGSSGIDAVNDLLVSFEAPVIFITAYPERLLTGDRPEPAFLITKPFQPEMVKAIISQALFFDQKSSSIKKAAVG